jgi:hypothetical protein
MKPCGALIFENFYRVFRRERLACDWWALSLSLSLSLSAARQRDAGAAQLSRSMAPCRGSIACPLHARLGGREREGQGLVTNPQKSVT